MRELPIKSCTAHREDGATLTLQYAVLVEEMPGGPESYGVKITETVSGESAMAPGLTTSDQKIYALVELLAENTVTPTGLMDVLADWLE